jgi:hypothetical protein
MVHARANNARGKINSWALRYRRPDLGPSLAAGPVGIQIHLLCIVSTEMQTRGAQWRRCQERDRDLPVLEQSPRPR